MKTQLAIEPGDSIAAVARKIDENRETIRRVVNTLEDEGYVEYDDGLRVVDHGVREAGRSLLAASAEVSPPSISEAYVLPHFAGMDFAYTSIDAVYVWTRGGYQVARDPDDYPLFIAVDDADIEEWEQFFHRFGIPVAQERQPADEIDGPLQFVIDPRALGGTERLASQPEREETPDERAAQAPSNEGTSDERAVSACRGVPRRARTGNDANRERETGREQVAAASVDGRPVISLQETVDFAREHYATFQSALDVLDRMYEDVDAEADYRMGPA